MAPQGRRREMGYGTEHQALYQHWPRKEEDCSSSEGTVVSSRGAGGDNRRLAVLGRQEPQELKVKALRPCLGKLVGLGGWTLQRREAQGSTQII